MSIKEVTEANRLAWNAIAPVHRRAAGEQLRARFAVPGASSLDEVMTAQLTRLGVRGKRVVQLCCNNGQELLSLMNLGAARAVGFDISDVVIEEARELAGIAGLECTFVACDVYEIPASYDGAFDLTVITVGALGWMPDLRAFFAVVGRLLAPGGQLLIYEMHPVLDMYEPNTEVAQGPSVSYFRDEPFVEEVGLDYVSKTELAAPPQHWFHHTLSAIFNGVVAAGISLTSFDELAHDISSLYPALVGAAAQPPMSYVLTGQKP
jgi:SAM-dependent methyltransferase